MKSEGFPPYHPMLMTKLIVYGYVRGVRSSRKVQRACLEDVAFRVLAVGQVSGLSHDCGLSVPVIWRPWRACLRKWWTFVGRAGLVKLGHLAVDSTKIRAHASKHKAMSYAPYEGRGRAAAGRHPTLVQGVR